MKSKLKMAALVAGCLVAGTAVVGGCVTAAIFYGSQALFWTALGTLGASAATGIAAYVKGKNTLSKLGLALTTGCAMGFAAANVAVTPSDEKKAYESKIELFNKICETEKCYIGPGNKLVVVVDEPPMPKKEFKYLNR